MKRSYQVDLEILSSSSKSKSSEKSIKEQAINEKMKIAELDAQASFWEEQKIQKLAVEEIGNWTYS